MMIKNIGMTYDKDGMKTVLVYVWMVLVCERYDLIM